MSQFELYHNFSFVIIWVLSPFEFCRNLSFFLVCDDLIFWGLCQSDVLSFVTLDFFSLIKIWVFEFHHNLSFWVSSKFEFLSFNQIWVSPQLGFWVYHNLIFWVISPFEIWVLSQFEFVEFWSLSFCENKFFFVKKKLIFFCMKKKVFKVKKSV